MISLHTDGSCHTHACVGAWVAILYDGIEKIVLQGSQQKTTHQRMELTAVTEGLAYLKRHAQVEQPVHLYTDSQYIVQTLNNREKIVTRDFKTRQGTAIRNADLVQRLFDYTAHVSLMYTKIKGHGQPDLAGEVLHREADRLSRRIVRQLISQQPR